MYRNVSVVLFGVVISSMARSAFASGQADPVAPVLLALAVLLASAKIGGHAVSWAGQPAVLGELLAGVLLGNLPLIGFRAFESLASDPGVELLAHLGVVILLFQVGLESTVREMAEVGWPSFIVAVVGVAAPFGLGFCAGWWFIPGRSLYLYLFLGATLTATSIGITARVLKDLNCSRTPEARIVLGAAVIDDVLGLIILAVVSGVIGEQSGGAVSATSIGLIVAKALGFLVGALAVGALISPRLFAFAARLEGEGVLLVTALTCAFLLSYAASRVGLSPIVGAYAAGLILEPIHFQKFAARGEHGLEDLVKPIGNFLAPVFFVTMGMQVKLDSFGRMDVLTLAGTLTVAAVLGKLACALVVPRGRNRLVVGFGMLPRGEVGLIFAGVGRSLILDGQPIVDEATFSAIVMMVVVTTLLTPPALKWALGARVGGAERVPPDAS